MSTEQILTNAAIVTRSEILHGTVHLRDGRIQDIDSGRSSHPAAVDCDGDYLIPGLIEIHTDNVEKHLLPRPGVVWPAMAALLAHDSEVAAAGITTVFDALAVGEYTQKSRRREMLKVAVEAIREARQQSLFKADHLLHMRLELADPQVIDLFEPHMADTLVRLVSLMDHTPGQRQWRDIEHFARFYKGKHGWTDAQVTERLAEAREHQARYAEPNRHYLLNECKARGFIIASHDDTTAEHVAEAAADGITISEFPTTREAAQAARDHGMAVVMGAPNVVRGQSHSGNVSATELAGDRLVDGLSSDYVPASLLFAAFHLHRSLDRPIWESLAIVTANPARMLGLEDRGEIAIGKRADLVRVKEAAHGPVVRSTWCGGERVV